MLALGLAVTIGAGTWIAGAPQLVSENLGRAAGGFSLLMTGYAIGAISAGVFLARKPVRRKALGSLVAWSFYLPAYLLIGFADSLAIAMAGAFVAALGESTAVVLLNSAAQEDVPDRVLGRVMGVISLVHRGAHATGPAPDRAPLYRGRARVRVRDRGGDRAARRALLCDVGGG